MLSSIGEIYSEGIAIFVEVMNNLIRCKDRCILTIIPILWVDNETVSHIDATYKQEKKNIDLRIQFQYTAEQLKTACKLLAIAYYKHLEAYHYKLTWHDEVLATKYADAVWDVYTEMRKKQKLIKGEYNDCR